VQVTGRRDTVLLVKDHAGHTFGTFVPFPWKNSKSYYGTGESFVFSMTPSFNVWPHNVNSFLQQDSLLEGIT
jgi:hypothetical protein